MAKDVKVIFRGNRSPSGKSNNVEYFIGKSRLEKLKKDPNNMMCNIDVYNQSLQKNDKWFCFNPSLATQQVGYSDNFKMIHDQSHRILHHNLY